MEGKGNNGGDKEEIFSKVVRAGKRTYFFDVRSTKGGDYYLTLTESKKRFDESGNFKYEKHKLFLYKEDFEKFATGLNDAVEYVKNNQEVIEEVKEFTDVNFEDLGSK